MVKNNVFKGTLTAALQASRLPSWQTKQQVPKHREGRLVIHKETRNLFREIARRNSTNMATAVWLAGYIFWDKLGYSRNDYNSIMVEPSGKVSRKDKIDLNEFAKLHGLLKDDEVPKTEEEHREFEEKVFDRVAKLNPEKQREFTGLLLRKGLVNSRQE